MDISEIGISLWRDVKGYEGLYEVSITGQVRSLSKLRKIRNHIQLYPSRILRPSMTRNGYQTISLWKDGEKKTMGVHRVLAEAFIDNPANRTQVNHINGIKSDNRIENLEWVTASENAIHAIRIGLRTF